MRLVLSRLLLWSFAALPLCVAHATPAESGGAPAASAARAPSDAQRVEIFVHGSDGSVERRMATVRVVPIEPRAGVELADCTVDGSGRITATAVRPQPLAEGPAR